MDLSSIKPIEKEFHVKHPATGEPVGLVLTLACAHDSRVKSAVRAINDEMLKAGQELTKEQEEEYEVALAAAYIVDLRWEGDATWNGKTPEYSAKLAREICANTAIRVQLFPEVNKIKDFYKP